MATIPHWTEANQKWAKNDVLPEWVMTFRDPIILNAWHAMLRAPKPERVSHLAALIRERHPRMHALYGPFLEAELTALASAALGNPDALNTPGFLQQFTPDNPIRRTPDGTWDIPPTLVEDRHFDQLRNYIRSLRPPRPTGRSKKPPSDQKPPRTNKRDPVLSAHAYELDLEKIHWTDIWRRLFPEQHLPHEKRGRDAAYQKVKGLIHNGRTIAYQKKATKP